jgi:hypothetical protein
VRDQSVQYADVTLSGLDEEAVTVIRSTAWHQRPVTIQRLILAIDTPQIINVVPQFVGHMDQARIVDDAAGGTLSIVFRCASASRENDRRGTSTRSDADQAVRDPNDRIFAAAASVINTPIAWGQEASRRAQRKPQSLLEKLF